MYRTLPVCKSHALAPESVCFIGRRQRRCFRILERRGYIDRLVNWQQWKVLFCKGKFCCWFRLFWEDTAYTANFFYLKV